MVKNEWQTGNGLEPTGVELRKMHDTAIQKYRVDIGGAGSMEPVQLTCRIVGFRGAKDSAFSDRINIVSRHHRIVYVGGEALLIPERTVEFFSKSVKAKYPNVVVKIGDYVSLD